MSKSKRKYKLHFPKIILLSLLFLVLVLTIFVSRNKVYFGDHAQNVTDDSLVNSSIKLIKSSFISNGLRTYYYWIYENTKYPCGKQGNHEFIIIQKGTGKDMRHLLVRHVGGFAGFYYPGNNGQLSYFPDSSFETLLYGDKAFDTISVAGLDRLIIDTQGWRVMSPSYCSHDFYYGTGQYNQTDGFARWGFNADKEAIDFTQTEFPTDKIVTYGTSAGSSGAFYQGISRNNVVGIVMDSFAVDLLSVINACEQGIQPYDPKWPCTCNGETCVRTIATRIGFNKDAMPYLLIQKGKVTKPIFLIWNKNDNLYNSHADLQFGNLQKAINTYNPGGKSVAREVCVNDPSNPSSTCNLHSPTLTNNPETTNVYNWIISIVGK